MVTDSVVTDSVLTDKADTMKSTARRQFDDWAETYNQSFLHHFMFRPTYRVLLEELVAWRGEDATRFRVLDIGCGTGNLAGLFAGSSLPARIIGLDYAPAMVRVARENAEKTGVDDDCTFLPGDSEHLPFADASFDLITCSHSFHHYPHKQETVREMRRVLRPGGRLIIVDGFRDNAVGWFVFDVCITAVEKDVYHVPWSEMRELFLRAGLTDVRHRKFSWWFPLLMTMGTA